MKKFSITKVNLDPTVGHEVKKSRPCIIISPDEMNAFLRTVIVVPLTKTNRALPTRVLIKPSADNRLTVDSYAMLDQIKCIDKIRIVSDLGDISEQEKQKLTNVLHQLFAY